MTMEVYVLAGFIAEKDVSHILVIFHSPMLFRVVVLLPGPRCLAYEAMSSGEAPRRFKEVNRKIQGPSLEIYKPNFGVWSILLSVLVFTRKSLGGPRIISLFYAHIGRNLLAFNRQQYTRKVEAPFLRLSLIHISEPTRPY